MTTPRARTSDASVTGVSAHALSVIVCAYTQDRWECIVDGIAALQAQSRRVEQIILVVDHNEDLLVRARAQFEGVDVLANRHEQGLSGARNTGLEEAIGDVVAFVDDDATPDLDWAATMMMAYDDPSVLGVGGHVIPRWGAPRPTWFPEEFLWVVGCSYRGLPRTRAAIRNPIGANMSFRSSALAGLGGFRSTVGRVGDNGAGCEETELSIRVTGRQPSGRVQLEPASVVHHLVTPQRTTRAYFRARCLAEGSSKAFIGQLVGSGPSLSTERSYATRTLPRGVAKGVREALSGDTEGLARSAAIIEGLGWVAAGYLRGRASLLVSQRNVRKAAKDLRMPPQSADKHMQTRNPVVSELKEKAPMSTSAHAGHVRGADAETVWTGDIWCCEVELSDGSVRSVVSREGSEVAVRVLARFDGEPLGYATFPTPGGLVDLEDVARRTQAAFPDGAQRAASRRLADVPCPSITVVVCTRDRTDSLKRALSSIQEQTYQPLEILIVDNAPTTDGTRLLVDELRATDPRLRYVLEARAGLSFARNTGLDEATGDIVAFTDDDVSVDPGWVHGVSRGFARRSDVGAVTGLVATAGIRSSAEAYFDARATSWSTRMEPTIFDATPRDALYPYSAGIFGTGANLAVKRELVRGIGGFDPRLGAGTATKGGEDLDMFVRIITSGRAIAYEPGAVVWHHHRGEDSALKKQMYAYGTGMGAYGAKLLLAGETRSDVLRRVPGAMLRVVSIFRATDERLTVTPPQGAKVAELLGLVCGPAIFLRHRKAGGRS